MVQARHLLWAGLAAVATGGVVWAFWPQPVPVDLAQVWRGPMEVTVAAEGVTSVRDPWTVTAPVAGTLSRPPVTEGQTVSRGETVVAVIRPAEPAFLDARARAEAQAAVAEAEAAVRLAEVNLSRAQSDLDFASSELARNRTLSARGIIPQRVLEDSQQRSTLAERALEAARFELDLHRATLARAKAQLDRPSAVPEGQAGSCCMDITAPKDGIVLQVHETEARFVPTGTPLVTIGNLADLGIEADLLSADAVLVRPGALAHVERWGGPLPLDATVTRIDPAGFARVSALGIEEQRVTVHLDITTPIDERPGLGDQYRVFVRIVIWSGDDILQVPQGALLRHGDGWAVFRAIAGRAVLTPVTVGKSQDTSVQILSGLEPGEDLISYPGASISDGARIIARTP
jgi:HlyD family secretion protein